MSCVCRFVLYLCGNKTKANEDMEKNIKERKVMTVKVKKPRYDMSGLIDAPTMPKKGKWERVCIEKTMEQ